MRKLTFGFALILAASFGSAPAGAAKASPLVPDLGTLPDSLVLVNRNILFTLTSEPTQHFYRAHEYFLQKNWKAASAEIRFTSALLDLAAADAAGKVDRQNLTEASRKVSHLAEEVKHGRVRSVLDMDPAFTDAYRVLMIHHHQKAVQAWKKRDALNTGRHLKVAVQYFEQDAVSADHRLDAQAMATLETTRKVSGELIENSGWTPEEVGKSLEDFGKEIKQLDETVVPKTR